MIIMGWNDFYSGWLARVFLQADRESETADWREGWKMADETGDEAIKVLQDEIRRGHVIVSSNAHADRERASRDTVRRVVRLWCPDCDRETTHDVSGAPVAECRDCLEPHEMTEAEIIKANDSLTGREPAAGEAYRAGVGSASESRKA